MTSDVTEKVISRLPYIINRVGSAMPVYAIHSSDLTMVNRLGSAMPVYAIHSSDLTMGFNINSA